MPSELEEVRFIRPRYDTSLLTRGLTKLVEFLHHGNTQIRQIGTKALTHIPPSISSLTERPLTSSNANSCREPGPILQELPLDLPKRPMHTRPRPQASDQGLSCV